MIPCALRRAPTGRGAQSKPPFVNRLENELSPATPEVRRTRRRAEVLPLPADEAPTGGLHGVLHGLAAILLLLGAAAIALVVDEGLLRQKMVWSRGLLMAAACVAALAQACAGQFSLRGATWLAAALVPGLLALLHPIHTAVASPILAHDEIQRLLLIPLCAWTASTLLARGPWRRAFLVLLGCCALLVGAYAMLQKLGNFGLVRQLLGLLEGAGLGSADAAPDWLPQTLLTQAVRATNRSYAGFGNPVFLGDWLVLTTPLLLADALASRSPWRWISALAAGLCLPAFMATESLGAWLGLGLAMLAGLWLLLPPGRPRRLMFAALLVGAPLLAWFGRDEFLRRRVHTLIWRDSWELFSLHPGGVGPGQFQIAFLPFASPELLAIHPRSDVIINDAHSEPLQLLVELGWPALLAVGVALLYGLLQVRQMLRQPWSDSHARALFVAALAGVVGCVGMSFVSPDLRFHVTMLALGLVIGFLFSMQPPLAVPLGAGPFGRLLVGLLALAGLWAAGSSTWERLRMVERLQPPAAPDVSPEALAAVEALRRAAEANAQDPAAWYAFGEALSGHRRFDEATAAFQRAMALDPGNVSIARSLGIVAALAGRYAEAVPHLRASLAERPDDGDVRYLLAYAAFGQGDLLTAAAEAEALLADEPDNVRALLLLERLRE